MAIEVRLTQFGMGMQDGVVRKWFKAEGEVVQEGEPLVEVEAAKMTVELPSPTSGVLLRILVPVGTVAKVRDVVAVLGEQGEVHAAERVGDTRAPSVSPSSDVRAKPTVSEVQLTPRARRMLRESGLDIASVKGTGPRGRITDDDVTRAVAERDVATRGGAAAGASPPMPPGAREPAEISLTGMRGAIARRMHESLRTMAQLTLTSETDVTDLVRLRESLKQQHDITYTDLVVRAVALALQKHPRMNATIEGEVLRVHPDVNVGVAVAIADGLVVPVIRSAHALSLRAVSDASRELQARARAGKLTPTDLTGATFTVTNLGAFGIDAFTPIVNPPEVGILGVGRIVERLGRRGDDLSWRKTMMLSLTFDHRATDGVPAAEFLGDVRRLLEAPDSLVG
jgi:pyruvate dehydrogenase E2 component (dihydrolipoamide acetyltransferase)